MFAVLPEHELKTQKQNMKIAFSIFDYFVNCVHLKYLINYYFGAPPTKNK